MQTQAATVADLLLEEHIDRSPDDLLDVDPDSAVRDGETIHYRAAVSVTLVVDGETRTVRSTDATVGDLLASQSVAADAHDKVDPAPTTALAPGTVVEVDHVSSWIEQRRKSFAAPVRHVPSFTLALGATKTIDPGLPGIRETSYLVVRRDDRALPPLRTLIATRVIRPARPRVVAAGIGEYAALASVALRGFDETVRLAKAAIGMIATAYTRDCYGCSGVTKMGEPAGHGIVAVDPAVIPLGTRLYIPGYGKAVAGDTGGAIRGKRIDLGFNSEDDANRFGRRAILVYVLPR